MGFLTLVAAGCEAQVGEDYEGEVLLTLQGNVKLDPETELLPKLAFYNDSDEAVEIIDTEVSGEFPAKFRLDVIRPPPDSALVQGEELAAVGMKGSAAVGFLVMLPPGHPSTIPRLASGRTGSCDAEGVCQVTDTACTEDGACRVRKLRCTERQCELFGTYGDPALKDAAGSSGGVRECLRVPYCYSVQLYCADDQTCYREFYDCDVSTIGEYDTVELSTVSECELLEETGDHMLSLDGIRTAGAGFLIFYVTEESPDSIFGPLKKGYNVVEVHKATHEEWMAQYACDSEDPHEPCGPELIERWRVVEDHTLTIDLGGPPLPF
jgi:hypothetical protein